MALDAMIINPLLESRMRFKQVGNSTGMFKHIQLVTTLQEGLARLEGPQTCDVLYVSSRFDPRLITEFVKTGRSSPRGLDSAYLMVMGSIEGSSENIARSLATGIDGFLVEPFSVDNLQDSARLAQKLKRQRCESRQKAAVDILISHAVQMIDEAAAQAKKALPYGAQLKKLQSLQVTLKELGPEMKQYYISRAIEKFGDAPVFLEAIKREYFGASKRVQARIMRK